MRFWALLILHVSLSLCAPFATAAEQCGSIFTEQPHFSEVLIAATKKAISKKGDIKGLSQKDLEFLVESVFRKERGKKHAISAYWKQSAEERTLQTIERQLGQEITQKGISQYFYENGLLVENSRLSTKIRVILNSRAMGVISLASTVSTMAHGLPPVFLPGATSRITAAELQTLLLRGFNSPEGKTILAKHKIPYELNRGYDLFSRYYSRLAVLAVAFIVFQKTQEFLEDEKRNESENAFDTLMREFEERMGLGTDPVSKEDILFATVLKNFQEKYSRPPTTEEQLLICQKVYLTSDCKGSAL